MTLAPCVKNYYFTSIRGALRIVEEYQHGKIGAVSEKPPDGVIESGDVFIYYENSNCRHEDDGIIWSSPEKRDEFLVYRELERSPTQEKKESFRLKMNGFLKKTLDVSIEGEKKSLHVALYYKAKDIRELSRRVKEANHHHLPPCQNLMAMFPRAYDINLNSNGSEGIDLDLVESTMALTHGLVETDEDRYAVEHDYISGLLFPLTEKPIKGEINKYVQSGTIFISTLIMSGLRSFNDGYLWKHRELKEGFRIYDEKVGASGEIKEGGLTRKIQNFKRGVQTRQIVSYYRKDDLGRLRSVSQRTRDLGLSSESNQRYYTLISDDVTGYDPPSSLFTRQNEGATSDAGKHLPGLYTPDSEREINNTLVDPKSQLPSAGQALTENINSVSFEQDRLWPEWKHAGVAGQETIWMNQKLLGHIWDKSGYCGLRQRSLGNIYFKSELFSIESALKSNRIVGIETCTLQDGRALYSLETGKKLLSLASENHETGMLPKVPLPQRQSEFSCTDPEILFSDPMEDNYLIDGGVDTSQA